MGEFVPGAGDGEALSLVRGAKILVIGAGGLGCEILKDLAMCGVVRDVFVIDLGELQRAQLVRRLRRAAAAVSFVLAFLFRTSELIIRSLRQRIARHH